LEFGFLQSVPLQGQGKEIALRSLQVALNHSPAHSMTIQTCGNEEMTAIRRHRRALEGQPTGGPFAVWRLLPPKFRRALIDVANDHCERKKSQKGCSNSSGELEGAIDQQHESLRYMSCRVRCGVA
jgi:hypothetical protein